MKSVIGLLFIVLSCSSAAPAFCAAEADHVRSWCQGAIEFRLPDTTRVDCLTDDYAIEFDWAKKWAEAIGQSLYYAKKTGRKPGVVLIVGSDDTRYVNRLMAVAVDHEIRVWLMEKIDDAK